MNSILEMIKTIDITGEVIIYTIVIMFFLALIANIIIKAKYMSLGKTLDNRQQRRDGVFKNDFLNKIVTEYKAAASSSYSDVNTQATIEKSFTDNMRFALIGETFVSKSISILIILGLLGTFIGLSISVSELVEVLGSESSSASGLDITNLLDNLANAATGMGAAFVTSLFGIFFSILMNIILIFIDCADEREKLEVSIEEYLDNNIAVVLSKDKETEYSMLNNILRDTFIEFGNKIENSLKQTVDEFGNKLTNVVMDVSVSSKVLDNTVDRFDACLVGFADNIRDFSNFNTNLSNNVEKMDVSFIKMSQSLSDSSNLIKDNFDAIKSFSQDVKTAASEMSSFNKSVVEDMQGLVDQVDKSVTSINQLSVVLKDSSDINAKASANMRSSFVESIDKINEAVVSMAEKTGKIYSDIMLSSSDKISAQLASSMNDAVANLEQTVKSFNDNQRKLAATITILPEQTMAYNKATTEKINQKLDQIKTAVEE